MWTGPEGRGRGGFRGCNDFHGKRREDRQQSAKEVLRELIDKLMGGGGVKKILQSLMVGWGKFYPDATKILRPLLDENVALRSDVKCANIVFFCHRLYQIGVSRLPVTCDSNHSFYGVIVSVKNIAVPADVKFLGQGLFWRNRKRNYHMSITTNMSGERELIAPLLFSGGEKLNLAVILHSLLKLRLPQTKWFLD